MRRWWRLFVFLLLSATIPLVAFAAPRPLPVIDPGTKGWEEQHPWNVRNLIDPEVLPRCWSKAEGGLELDLKPIEKLLDDTPLAASEIYGRAMFGPYPFESAETAYAYKRFRKSADIEGGRGHLDIAYLYRPKANSEGWGDTGRLAVRLELYQARKGADRFLGRYDTFVSFKRLGQTFVKRASLLEGPLVNLITSDDPSKATIAFRVDERVAAEVRLANGRRFRALPAFSHTIEIEGLVPGEEMGYEVWVDGQLETRGTLRAAPEKGTGPVTIAYVGDSREGAGGVLEQFMGTNTQTLERLAALSFVHNADLFLMGGDLINGYTTVPADFVAQIRAWKQAMSGFWRERPVYPAMGNHEALLRTYRQGDRMLQIDRWPYRTDSAETRFALEFVNPAGAPEPADIRRPSYDESVFAFSYGPVRIIAFNNNYWFSDDPKQFGGSPEGYILDDQMDWIEAELEQADADKQIRYILLYAQEPVLPNGGHTKDAMWYEGDNTVRAYTVNGGVAEAHVAGIIEVRNRLLRAASASPKTVAILTSDEHAYHRTWIDKEVPVGVPGVDDKNGDGKIDWDGAEPASPLSDLEHGFWHITGGGGGAPYYAEQPTPWNRYWRAREETSAGYRYTSQENVLLLTAETGKVVLEAINPYGETVDRVDDLMAPPK